MKHRHRYWSRQQYNGPDPMSELLDLPGVKDTVTDCLDQESTLEAAKCGKNQLMWSVWLHQHIN